MDSRCSSCRLRPCHPKARSEFLGGTRGALNRWGSAWENCKKLIDSHCSNLFSRTVYRFARLACELRWICWLSAQKRFVDKQVGCVTLSIYITRHLAWRQEWCKSIKSGAKDWTESKWWWNKWQQMPRDAFWPTHFSNRTHSRVQHTQGAHVWATQKKWWAMSERTAYDLRLKVLKLLAYFSKTFESSGRKWRGEDRGWAEMGFATSYLHYTERKHNFSMIACATSYNSRFCCRKPCIRQAED